MKKLFRKRRFAKISIWFKKKFNPNDFDKITKTERDAVIIFNALVKHHDSDLLIHPSHERYYIKSQQTGIFITISTYQPEISIVNHVYGYNVKISNRVLKSVVNTFITEVENRRIQMENEYKNNIQHSLNHIARTIKERL
jgi:hypothetical protein